MNASRRLLSFAALAPLAVALPLALAGCSKGREAKETTASAAGGAASTAAPALPADVAPVAAELAAQTTADAATASAPTALAATGEFVSPVTSDLVVRTPGRVARMLVDEGDAVRRGQPLLELETGYLRPDAARAEAELGRARAAAAEAKADFDRKQELLSRNAVPQSTFDRSKSGYDQAQAAVEAASAAAALARQRLADAVLRSPIDGIVAEKRTDVGERLGDNSVAFVLVQTKPLKLRFTLPERELPRVTNGQRVTATVDAYPGESFTGLVTMAGRVVDARTRTFPVEARFDNADGRLRPGMFARVDLGDADGAAAAAAGAAVATTGR